MKLNFINKSSYLFLLVLLSLTVFGQEQELPKTRPQSKFEPNDALIIAPSYTAQFPFGNMADRFGFNNQVSLNLMYKMKKNWLVGIEGGFMFGDQLRENYIIDKITTSTGHLIGTNNDLIRVRPQMQGFTIKAEFGKIIPFSPQYPDAGLLFITGFGMLQHKIWLNVRETSVPQLSKIYRKGYDRMCNGPVISQFVGGTFMARRKYYSFYAGLQFDVAFTKDRRNFDFYEQRKLTENRVDMFLGLKVGWILPIFLQANEKEYYYY
ncbi:MAG: hypothetical protein U0V74_17505 [Chitinophagales bacterium]